MKGKKRTPQKGRKPVARAAALLIFPPQWTPQNPHYAMCSLAGHLRSKGYEVRLCDLNLEFYDHVLTPEYLKLSVSRLKLAYDYLKTRTYLHSLIDDRSLDSQIEASRFLAIEDFFKEKLDIVKELPSLILDAKETLRDPRRFYNPVFLVEAFKVIDDALKLVSLPYHPACISFNGYSHPHGLLTTYDLIKATADPRENMFYDFMKDHVQDLLKDSPDFIGISINSTSQVLAGLTIARMLKEAAPESCHINIGGNFFGRVQEALLKRPEFFRTFAHSLSMGEGEKQIHTFIKTLEEHKDLSGVPDILYLDEAKGKVLKTRGKKPEKLDKTGCQDPKGLPLDRYFTPDIVCCIQASKGCYWGKCTFCDTDFGINRDVKSIDRLIGELRYLKESYGISNFEFTDESVAPEYLRELSEKLLKEDLKVHWFINGRTEEGFTRELLELAHRAGLTLILWGFESGSDRIMKLINKGIDMTDRYRILRDSKEAGIWNFAYIFFGFPTETGDEAMATINAICDNRDIIHSYGRSVFTLGKHSLLHVEAEKYGIVDITEDIEELSSNLHYSCTRGMSDREVDEMMRHCTRICAEKYDYGLWYYLRYRENIHLYLVRHGLEYIDKFKMRQALEARANVW
ncbi:MAG: radical SAM protein [Chloroflexi bacterium]|nr:radical SAM protein [Chloroflexota bacterium]